MIRIVTTVYDITILEEKPSVLQGDREGKNFYIPLRMSFVMATGPLGHTCQALAPLTKEVSRSLRFRVEPGRPSAPSAFGHWPLVKRLVPAYSWVFS